MMTRNRHTEGAGLDCTRRVSHQSGTANPPRLIMVVFPGRLFQTARKYCAGGFYLAADAVKRKIGSVMMREKEKRGKEENGLPDDVCEDTIRMDWLSEVVKNGRIVIKGMTVYDFETLREAVDAAMKED